MRKIFWQTLTLWLPLKIIIFVCLTWNSIIKITLLQHYQGKGTRWGLGGTSLCVSVTVVADWMGDNLRCVIVRTLFILISKQMGYEKIALLNLKGQLISECPFGVWKFSKIPPKNLIDFCPRRLYRLGMFVLVNMYCI